MSSASLVAAVSNESSALSYLGLEVPWGTHPSRASCRRAARASAEVVSASPLSPRLFARSFERRRLIDRSDASVRPNGDGVRTERAPGCRQARHESEHNCERELPRGPLSFGGTRARIPSSRAASPGRSYAGASSIIRTRAVARISSVRHAQKRAGERLPVPIRAASRAGCCRTARGASSSGTCPCCRAESAPCARRHRAGTSTGTASRDARGAHRRLLTYRAS